MVARHSKWLVLVFAAAAYGLYLWDIGSLKVYGDGGQSIYWATRSVRDILFNGEMGSPQPFYFLLLKPWLAATGINELTARWPSIAAAVLAIALVYRLAVANSRAALTAALLLAASPLFYYYARHPRMYSLVSMLALLGSLLLLRAVERPRPRRWVAYGLALLATVLTHYYSLLLPAAHAVYLLWRRPRRRAVIAAVVTWVAAAIPAGAWLAYAMLASLERTRSQVGTGPPPGVATMLATTWTSFNLGAFVADPVVVPASLAVGLIWAVGLVSVARVRPRPGPEVALAIAVLAVTLAGSYFMAAVLSLFHPRYFLFALPFYVSLLGWTLSRTAAALAWPAVAVLLVLAAVGINATRLAMAQDYEADAVRTSERVAASLRPNDLVLLHAQWQAGYLLAHHRVAAGQVVGLSEVPSETGLAQRLAGAERIWFATYGMPVAWLPQGQWLLDHAYLADDAEIGQVGLYLFGGLSEVATQPVARRFANGVELVSAGFEPADLAHGDVLRVRLVWQATTLPPSRSTVFLHLEGTGAGLGRDGDPSGGRRPVATWRAGDIVDDRRGLLIDDSLPAGRYRLVVGWYDPETGRRFLADDSQDALLLGMVAVE